VCEQEIIESHEEQISASMHWILPNQNDLQGLWESLVFEDDLKEKIFKFAKTILHFSHLKIDQNIVSCNRLILLHGCPGTGKTSLAKALAQKLSIHLNEKYQFTHLFEINSHALFSKYFSESGKLVMKMFQQIQEVIEMESCLVVILIDEVESIAYARGNISDNEPSDSVRVVNSVLTQLDRIKKYPNVLVVTTSNLTKSIDLAFLDRADIVSYIEQPSTEAVFKIVSSSIIELADKGIIQPDSADDGHDEFNISTIEDFETFHQIENSQQFSTANIMAQVCKEAAGLSGRLLRKLPFLAHALFLKKDTGTLREFLIAMRAAIDYSIRNKANLGQHNQIKE
jgi:pachytene checkpoint protein 2